MKPGRAERKNRGLSSQNRNGRGRKKPEGKGKGRRQKRKASTRGTAVGAKRGRTKGNEQKAEYENLEGRHERSGRRERGNRGSESGDGNCGSHCEAEAGMAERKKQRLSSEMLKRKRRSSSGSQAPAPEKRFERGSPVERLRERSRVGRKETNSKSKYENRERRHERSGWEERGKPGSESGGAHRGSHCEAETGRAERKKQRAE